MALIFLINGCLVAVAILMHFEALNLLSLLLSKLHVEHRLRVMFAVFGALLAHILEIWLFAFAYFFIVKAGIFGSLAGNFNNSLLDCSYFSFATYTSLGFGDIEPLGGIRFLAGLEALTGLVLISWTASFVFLEMQKQWKV